MKIEPIKISITDEKDAINMYVSASDSWGNENQESLPSYEAIAILTDEDNAIKKRLNVKLVGEEYEKWDGKNSTILQMFLDKYDWLKILN